MLTIDFETYSELDVTDCGAWRYSEHLSTEILMLAWALDDEAPVLWTPGGLLGEAFPEKLSDYLVGSGPIDAHGAGFEEAIWTNVGVPRHGFPPIEPNRWRCTMARAAERALPLGLDAVGDALDLLVRKDKEGRRLMSLLSKPQKPTKKDSRTRIKDPWLMDAYGDYCKQDVRVERAVRTRLGHSPAAAQQAYLLNERINRRGFAVDMEAVAAARHIVADVENRLGAEFRSITGLTFGQRDKVLQWLAARGLDLPDFTADTVKAQVAQKHGGEVGRALELRAILAKSSTKKLAAFEKSVCSDGRIRGSSQYHGAFTGRNAGRLVQPLNFPRPSNENIDLDWLIEAIKTRDTEFVDMVYGDAMLAVSDALRPMIVAASGKKLVAADLTAIEAVGLACLSGEKAKIDVFRRGEDPYCAAASIVFGYKVESKKTHPKERQSGKTCELAFGYGGGVGAWRNFDDGPDHSDDDVRRYRDAWRRGNPAIPQYWSGLEYAAIEAVRGGEGEYLGISYCCQGDWLVCGLPSGRSICYHSPEVTLEEMPWGGTKPVLSYLSWKEGQWKRVQTWGGKLTENVTQAACRDVLVEGMFETEAAGLPIVLTVYDEIVCEVDADRPDAVDDLVECITRSKPWRDDWPVRAEGWEGRRYHK